MNFCAQQRASTPIDKVLAAMQLYRWSDSDSSEDDATCPKYGATYANSAEKSVSVVMDATCGSIKSVRI